MTVTIFNTFLLGLGSLTALILFYLAAWDISENLSPQGCRMSWMSPSYVLQSGLNSSWTPLATRYSLSLYREVGWEPDKAQGTPVLFIPGNAGSSHQVRSIASSAARQFYPSPFSVAPEFSSRNLKSLDFFAVDFNEDLSAFHGPTLDSQITYTSNAISYILSLYPPGTSVIVMGHSMGGIVATSLLPSPNISAVITMSTPHTLPPARFDSRIDKIYSQHRQTLIYDPTPILSLCGGATDMMIPSESCILPNDSIDHIFRRTVFTSALEGAWTGVGHREMVWCHQVRWRVARAVLELGDAPSHHDRGVVLDRWLRDGHSLPPIPVLDTSQGGGAGFTLSDPETYQIMEPANNLILSGKYLRGARTFMLPLPSAKHLATTLLKAVVFVGMGSISTVGPQHLASSLRASVHICTPTKEGPRCRPLNPAVLRLIPNPLPGTIFPVPNEGTDESEGVVLFEADLTVDGSQEVTDKWWLGVHVENSDGKGWVVAGLTLPEQVVEAPTTLSLIFKNAEVLFSDGAALRTHYVFPNLISHTLLVYRYTPIRPQEDTWCSDPLLASLISHTSQPVETHYYPINMPSRRILLHSHSSAPYVETTSAAPRRTLEFIIYSSGKLGCDMLGFTISIDWSATLGRWASRYLTTIVAWAVGVVAINLFAAWGATDHGAAVPSLKESLRHFDRNIFPNLMVASFVIALFPLPVGFYIGTGGEVFFAPIAPLLLLIASGLVCISWWMLECLVWPVGVFGSLIFGRSRVRETASVRQSTIISMSLIFVLILLFIPWQVAYLGCWLIHLFTCASSARHVSIIKETPPTASAIPLIRRGDGDGDDSQDGGPVEVLNHEAQRSSLQKNIIDNHNHNMHLLLLMTWLLPLVAPVLAVWVRTLATAGLTTPFDGDHDILNAAPFLILVDFTSWNTDVLFDRQKFERPLSVRWLFAVLASTAFFVGPRRAYSIFDAAKVAVGIIVVIRVGRRYWGGAAWSQEKYR